MANKDSKIITSTQRLDFIPFDSENLTHSQFLMSLWNTPLFISSCGKTSIDTPEKAKVLIINRFLKEYARNGYGTYILRLKPDFQTEEITKNWPENFVGTISLTIGDSPTSHTAPDIGFATVPEIAGKGFATEAAKGVMEWASKEKGIIYVFGFCDPSNKASAKVMEKVGMEFRGIKKLSCFGGVTSLVYATPNMDKDLTIYNLKD